MVDKTVLQSEKGLPNIVHTVSAGDGTDQIGAPAGNFGHAVVSQFCHVGKAFTGCIDERAIFARNCVAEGETSLKRC